MAVNKGQGKRKIKKNPKHVESDVLKKIAAINARHSDKSGNRLKKNTSKPDVPEIKTPMENPASDGDDSDSELASGQLMLKDVLDLGGTKDDFDLVKDVSEVNELIPDDANDDAFDVGELVTFMKANGMSVPKKEKKSKEGDVKVEKSKEIEKTVIDIKPPNNKYFNDKLLFQKNEPWYMSVETHRASSSHPHVELWRAYAQNVWDAEVETSAAISSKHNSHDHNWMKTVFAGGTINDKISAHCLLIQESPVHHMKSVEALIGMAKKKSKRLAITAIETLKEMFLTTILPDNRKLSNFSQHNFNVLHENSARDRLVLGWIVEDKLKQLYSEFLDLVKLHLKDNEVPIRTKLCNLSYQLLNEKPEQEQELLSVIVNKIGDPDKKLASKIIYILGMLLQNHPGMKKVVASEIERILYRSNISERAQYYAVCFLNQLKLSQEEGQLAGQLLKIYFSFFKELVERKNVDSRMLGALLTGVNRSYPYTTDSDAITTDNITTLFRLVYAANFNVAVQALMLLFQVSGKKSDISDRYYQALYAKLLDSGISSSSKKTLLLNLIYKSLKRDSVLTRNLALARRLLQVANLDDPVLACASLYAISAANKDSVEASETSNNAHPLKQNKKEDKTLESESNKTEVRSTEYSVTTRNPLYSSADKLPLWEFNLLNRNYHPSVSMFVEDILTSGEVSYAGDPFADFTQIKFLDKFVFKNPKKNVKAANKAFYSKRSAEFGKGHQVYSTEFAHQAAKNVDPADVFFYDYFKSSTVNSKKSQGLDFADEMKATAVELASEKKKKVSKSEVRDDEDFAEDSDEGSETGSEFSYGDIDEDKDELDKNKDSIYERVLWENLNSDGESADGEESDGDGNNGDDGDEEVEDSDADKDYPGDSENEWEDLEVAGDSDDGSEFVDGDIISRLIEQQEKKTKKKQKGGKRKLFNREENEPNIKKPKRTKQKKNKFKS